MTEHITAVNEGADIGVTGMAVMGRNLARNIASRGYTVAVHNRTPARAHDLVARHGGEGRLVVAEQLTDLVAALPRPRRVIVMVKAGEPTDQTIDALAKLLEPGDVLVDAGNAHYLDTQRRQADLSEQGIHLLGTGVSGGEEGALRGPSIMPGGDAAAYRLMAPVLDAIAARVDGEACSGYVGPGGAGHFVKMVHNGIEYVDMQLIAESYDVLRSQLGSTPAELADVFDGWNEGELDSFLIEITARVLRSVDVATGRPFVDIVRDEAEQKGTGRWSVEAALALGVPSTAMAEAVAARATSGSRAAARRGARRDGSGKERGLTRCPAGRPARPDRGGAAGTVGRQGGRVRPGPGPDPCGQRRQRLGCRPRGGGLVVARRLHHPGAPAARHQVGVRA